MKDRDITDTASDGHRIRRTTECTKEVLLSWKNFKYRERNGTSKSLFKADRLDGENLVRGGGGIMKQGINCLEQTDWV